MTPLHITTNLNRIDFEALKNQTLHIKFHEYVSIGPQVVFTLHQDDRKDMLDPYVIYMAKYSKVSLMAKRRDGLINSLYKTIIYLQKELAIHILTNGIRDLDRHKHVTSEEEAAALENEAYENLKRIKEREKSLGRIKSK